MLTERTWGSVKKITFAWTSDALGDATAVTTQQYDGAIQRLVTVPGTAGDQPTNLYDVVVQDGDGVDVLFGEGEDRSNVNTEQVNAASLGIVGYSTLTFVISGAGDSNTGVVHLYIR